MTAEPRVEELLATIRRAIDRDINELDARAGTTTSNPASGPLAPPETPVPATKRLVNDPDRDIASLRQRVHRNRLETPSAPPAAPTLRPQPSLYDPWTEPAVRQEPAPPYLPHMEPWPDAPQAQPIPVQSMPSQPSFLDQPDYYQQPTREQPAYEPLQDQALLSPQAAYAAQASFQALANSMMAQLGGDQGLQDRARELLKPMLKHWLDENLPTLVERLVRDEIERVARRGR